MLRAASAAVLMLATTATAGKYLTPPELDPETRVRGSPEFFYVGIRPLATSSGERVWEIFVVEVERTSASSNNRNSVVGAWSIANNRVEGFADYTPEGRAQLKDSSGAVVCDELNGERCTGPAALPFGFNAALKSQATGLVYMRNRWYSPELAQFLSHDPIGYADSFSLYAFTGFDPINRWDPFGLAAPACPGAQLSCRGAGITPSGEIVEAGKAGSTVTEGAMSTFQGTGQAGVQTAVQTSQAAGYVIVPSVPAATLSMELVSTANAFWGGVLTGIAAAIATDPQSEHPNVTEPATSNPVSLPGGSSGHPGTSDPTTQQNVSDPSQEPTRSAVGGTYALVDPATGKVMRTGGTNDLRRRELEHKRDPATRDYQFEVDVKTDIYAEQRGREQRIHDIYNPPMNRVNPISPKNPNRQQYIDAAKKFEKKLSSPKGACSLSSLSH